MIPLLLLGCAQPAAIPGGALDISLDGSWKTATRPMPFPRRDAAPWMSAHRTLVLPKGWDPATHVVFHAEGLGWRPRIEIDGVYAGSDAGGLRAVDIDLTGKLHAGAQELTLVIESATSSNIVLGKDIPAIAAWTYDQPRAGDARDIGEMWLAVGEPRRVDDLSVALHGHTLTAAASVVGADGVPLTFTVVRDGTELARFPEATVTAGKATASATWDGPLWQPGGSEEPFLQYLVATLPSGESRQLRFGARDAEVQGKAYVLNGAESYLAVERFVPTGAEPRNEIAGVAAILARDGLNGMELHAALHGGTVMDAADELGLFVVVTPRCDGRRRLNGVVAPTPDWAAFVQDGNQRIADSHREHPSLALWNIEAPEEPGYPTLYSAFAASGVPTVDLSDSLGYNDESYARMRAEHPLPLFINELAWHAPVLDGQTLAQRVGALVREHRPVGVGMVVPNVSTGQDPRQMERPEWAQYAADLAATLGDAHVAPMRIGKRRGPAAVQVTVTRAGRPAVGEVVLLRVPGQPPVAALSDDAGKATISLDYAGKAEVGVLGRSTWTTTALTPGSYDAGKWAPSVASATLALP